MSDSDIVEIKLAGPAKNALGTEVFQFLLDQLAAAGGKPVLLTGSGDAFSAGLNLKEVASLDAAGMDWYLRLLERCMSAYYLYPAPVVAAVNGHAIAGGCVLTLCCDHRVASADPRVRIGLNEVALGVPYPPRVFRIVRERVPAASIHEVVLGAGLFTPERACALGLVDEVAGDALAVAKERLAARAAHPAVGYAAAKRVLRGAVDADLASDEAVDAWLRASVEIWAGDAVKARVMAVLRR